MKIKHRLNKFSFLSPILMCVRLHCQECMLLTVFYNTCYYGSTLCLFQQLLMGSSRILDSGFSGLMMLLSPVQ